MQQQIKKLISFNAMNHEALKALRGGTGSGNDDPSKLGEIEV